MGGFLPDFLEISSRRHGISRYLKDTASHSNDDEDSRRNETIFIDRDPTYFPLLLKYLRERKVRLSMTAREVEGLREEAEVSSIEGILFDLLRMQRLVLRRLTVGRSVKIRRESS